MYLLNSYLLKTGDLPLTLNQQLPARGDQKTQAAAPTQAMSFLHSLCTWRCENGAMSFFENRTNQPALLPRQAVSEAPLLSSNTLCTYPPNSLSTPLHTQPSSQKGRGVVDRHLSTPSCSQESVWFTESVSEHTEKDVDVLTIRTYLCVYTLLSNTLHTGREAQPSK